MVSTAAVSLLYSSQNAHLIVLMAQRATIEGLYGSIWAFGKSLYDGTCIGVAIYA